jgi:hypothetical protein
MNKDPGVRVKIDTGFTAARVGQIIFPPAMLREKLLQRGIVEEVTEPSKAKLVKR